MEWLLSFRIIRAGYRLAKRTMGIFSRRQKRISQLRSDLSRGRLKRDGRILFIDDERPDLVDYLLTHGFAVHYVSDIDQSNAHLVEGNQFDLVLLDFHNVGKSFGPDHGLDLLRFLKRVNPALVVLTYTSKSLGTDQAEFYRLADGMLKKDAGLADSLERVEVGLRQAMGPENLWKRVLTATGVEPGSAQDLRMQDLAVRSRSSERVRNSLNVMLTSEKGADVAQAALETIKKILDLVTKDEEE